MFASKANKIGDDAALLHKKEQLYKQELAWMRRQPTGTCDQATGPHINRFPRFEKVSGGVAETDLTMNFETSRIGKRSHRVQDVSFAPMKTSPFARF